MAYELNHWTKATLEVLEFLDGKERSGEKVTTKDFPSRTLINWFYPLRKGGYIEEKGTNLTKMGRELLEQLKVNKPSGRRGRRTKLIEKRKNKEQKNNIHTSQPSRVLVQGENQHYERLITREEADLIIEFILKLKNKEMRR